MAERLADFLYRRRRLRGFNTLQDRKESGGGDNPLLNPVVISIKNWRGY
jgi:hypothetical protein